MTDIILINFRNKRDMYPPLGIMSVADALMQQGHSVAVWHEPEEALDEFIAAVERERPLWVGFSTITGPQLKTTIDATKRVHALGIPTVWGGVHATIMPEEVLRENYVDFVVVNEGELTAQEFTHELQNGRNWAEVRGLAWKDEDNRPVVNMERPGARAASQAGVRPVDGRHRLPVGQHRRGERQPEGTRLNRQGSEGRVDRSGRAHPGGSCAAHRGQPELYRRAA